MSQYVINYRDPAFQMCEYIARDVRMNMNCVRTNGSQHTPYAGPSGITSRNSLTFVKMMENHS